MLIIRSSNTDIWKSSTSSPFPQFPITEKLKPYRRLQGQLLLVEQRPGTPTAHNELCKRHIRFSHAHHRRTTPTPKLPGTNMAPEEARSEIGGAWVTQEAEPNPGPPSQQGWRAVLPRAVLAEQQHQHISPGVMRPLLRGPAMNEEEENSDSTPLLPSARQTEAGERLLGVAFPVAGGSWPGGILREWLRAMWGRVQPRGTDRSCLHWWETEAIRGRGYPTSQ